jgi:hypothetical protein
MMKAVKVPVLIDYREVPCRYRGLLRKLEYRHWSGWSRIPERLPGARHRQT